MAGIWIDGVLYRAGGQQLSEEEFIVSLPPGFRFKPTDEELVEFYLMRKVKNLELPFTRIREVDLYKFPTPESLIATYPLIEDKESEWYFFTPRTKKYLNGDRPDRSTPGGYWKATSGDAPVLIHGQIGGKKRTLCFYKGQPMRGEKTNWIMHEFRINEQDHKTGRNHSMKLDDWVLCQIYERNVGSSSTTQTNTADVPNDTNQEPQEQQQILQNRIVVHSGTVVPGNAAVPYNAIQHQQPPEQNGNFSRNLGSGNHNFSW